jgi:hypothetical protein
VFKSPSPKFLLKAIQNRCSVYSGFQPAPHFESTINLFLRHFMRGVLIEALDAVANGKEYAATI